MRNDFLENFIEDGISFVNIRCPFCGYRHPIRGATNLIDWYDGCNYEYICKITNIEFVFAYDEIKKGIYVSVEDLNTKTVLAVHFVEFEKLELDENNLEIKFEVPITTAKAKKVLNRINQENKSKCSDVLLFVLKIENEWLERTIKDIQKKKEDEEKKKKEEQMRWMEKMDILIEDEEI